MEIRIATDNDIPDIVALLKISLGESLMPKSEGYWIWKHIENSFGKSPVLLAYDGSKLVGVRAFMRWTWQVKGEIVESVRAVDTATHPDFQGKGIFRKLTLSLLEQCPPEVKFVFNTPNEKSKPGYLKMGWTEGGKLPLHLHIIRPLKILQNIVSKPKDNRSVLPGERQIARDLNHQSLHTMLEKLRTSTEGIRTLHTVESLRWRYLTVPNVIYDSISVAENDTPEALLIYRLKNTRIGLELRITDLFSISVEGRSKLIPKIREAARKYNVDYITSSGLDHNFSGIGLGLRNLKLGPIVTVRSIQKLSLEPLLNFSEWRPSLGDLELF